MKTFDQLIYEVQKGYSASSKERLYFFVDGNVQTSKPAFWKSAQQIAVEVDQACELNLKLEFQDARPRKRFEISIYGQPQLRDDPKKHFRLIEERADLGGLRRYVSDQIREAVDDWTRDVDEADPVKAILESKKVQSEASSLEVILIHRLEEMGFEIDSLAIEINPWISRSEIQIDEDSLKIRLEDVNRELSVQLSAIVVPDETNPNYYTNETKASGADGDGESIKQNLIKAVRDELAGTRFHDWIDTDGTSALREKTIGALERKAAEYGWKLGPGIFVESEEAHGRNRPPEIFSFPASYPIPGVGRKLEINHSGAFELVNAAAYEQKKNIDKECLDFKKFVEANVKRITGRKINGSSYSSAIFLLGNIKEFEAKVASDLEEFLKNYGYSCDSCHLVLQNFPEAELLQEGGYSDLFLEKSETFSLRDSDREAQLGVFARLKLIDPEKLEPHLEPDATNIAPIKKLVAEKLRRIVSVFLNRLSLEDYHLSDLGDGERLPNDVEEQSYDADLEEYIPITFRALQNKLGDEIKRELILSFGLEASDIEIFRGYEFAQDRLDKLKANIATITVESENQSIESGKLEKVKSTLQFQIIGKSPQHAELFAASAHSYDSDEKHLTKIIDGLSKVLKNLISPFRTEHLSGQGKGAIANAISRTLTGTAQRNYGLNISIEPGSFDNDAPIAARSTSVETYKNTLRILNDKIANLYTEGPEESDAFSFDANSKTWDERLADTIKRKEEVEQIILNEQTKGAPPVMQNLIMIELDEAAKVFRQRVQSMRLPGIVHEQVDTALLMLPGANSEPHAKKEFEDAEFDDGPDAPDIDNS